MIYIVLTIIVLFLVIAISTYGFKYLTLDHPLLLIVAPIWVNLLLLFILSISGVLEPNTSFGPEFVLFLGGSVLLISLPFFVFPPVLSRDKLPVYSIVENPIFFRICALIGGVGTLLLVSGLVANPTDLIFMLSNDISAVEKGFFNNSGAILWQANIAALFWFALIRNVSKIDLLLLSVCIVGTFLRIAFLYLIIAFFYFSIPYLVRKEKNIKQVLRVGLIFVALIHAIVFLSYSFDGEVSKIYFSKIYPYTSGNLVNLNIHLLDVFPKSLAEIKGGSDLLDAFGLTSFAIYFSDYIGFDIKFEERMVFFKQTKNALVYGNTHTLFGQLLYIPTIFYFLYLPFFGFVLNVVYRQSRKSFTFLVIHSWFCAASFLSFAGAGHFNTTRIFPALLFIFPFFVVVMIYFKINKACFLK